MDYILSPCTYTAEGLASIMGRDCLRPIQLNSKSLDSLMLASSFSARRLVVFLPDDPLSFFKTLQQTAFLLKRTINPVSTIILTNSPSGWLWNTLAKLVTNRRLLSEVRSIPTALPLKSIAEQLDNNSLSGGWGLEEQAKKEKIYNCPSSGLTKAELNAILHFILEHNFSNLSKQRGIKSGTLYNQKKSGLEKISKHYPLLSVHFPGNFEAKQRVKNISISPLG